MDTISKKRKVIAIDFDGTITDETPYPITGKIRPEAVRVIKRLQKEYDCVLWTCRWGADLTEAINLLAWSGLVFEYINEVPYDYRGSQRKIRADIYIDNKGYGTVIDWEQIEKDLLGEKYE